MRPIDCIPAAALELETRSLGADWQPTLGPAYELLRDEWRSGVRGRDRALHLAFLSWYLGVEPNHFTGKSDAISVGELEAMFAEAHAFLLPSEDASDDAEALYVIGVMMRIYAYSFSNHEAWTARSLKYQAGYRRKYPSGIDPRLFEGRGAYGHYFHGHAVLENAY